ncbi:unnamed protein product [Allacma fusca]|uniref:Hermansky-Pudlak syndrome 1 protein homolog n=1 Tax=Allacma fusca TaxID=39272 RepID=A0A8J2NML3_9HEXA|nr:unnamed protein product [Allacma fusca]
MRGLLVFDHSNDVVYINCCTRFVQHVAKLAKTQGLVGSEFTTLYGTGRKAIDPNILIQLFSPLVTSQRFMKEQFGNPYASVQCEDGTNIVFQEYMGFLFLRIGTDEIPYLKRALGVCITLVTYICGPDVGLLKVSPRHAEDLNSLLKTWSALQSCDQSFLVEALEQVPVNPQYSTMLIKSLQQITAKVQTQNEYVQALLFMDTKLLSWYSSKGAFQMAPEDILVMIILLQKIWPGSNLRNFLKKRIPYAKLGDPSSSKGESSSSETDSGDDDSEWKSSGLRSPDTFLDELNDFTEADKNVAPDSQPRNECEFKHYLLSLRNGTQFVPHRVHIGKLHEGLHLVLLLEPPISVLITSLCTLIQIVTDFSGARRDIGRDKQYLDVMESSMKKIADLLKKQKNLVLKNELNTRWLRFKTGFQLYLKTKDTISVQVNPIIDALIGALRIYFNEQQLIYDNPKVLQPLTAAWNKAKVDTREFWDCQKAVPRVMSIGTRQTLNKYMEEFPGLVHFIYVDRDRHAATLPSLDSAIDDAVKLTKRKIWSMVKFAREHMQEGHFSLMWKDSAFNFAYFLWFEDQSGVSVRAKNSPSLPWDNYSPSTLPGIMCGDFYRRLVQECFPGSSTPKIRCLELFCIHLGLVTSSLVLEHSKRLAATIHDATRVANHVDLL